MVDYRVRVSGRLVPGSQAKQGYLYVASHIGVMLEYAATKDGNNTVQGCSASEGTGQLSRPPFSSIPMCNWGKDGFQPNYLHTTHSVPGFVLQLEWNTSGWAGAAWTLRAGTSGACARSCPSRTVATGRLPNLGALGSWVALDLTAKRSSTPGGNTTLRAAVNGTRLGAWEVPFLAEARGAIALGNGVSGCPISEWDDLRIDAASASTSGGGGAVAKAIIAK